jgi:hypothetical protein
MRLLPGRTEFFRYEGELNRFALRHPQAILCLYDLDRFVAGSSSISSGRIRSF